MHCKRIAPFHTSRRPLAAALGTLLGVCATDTIAATAKVSNCNDSGSGSLREAVTYIAESGDTVDMTTLTCGVISLTTGAINVTQNDLTFSGPGRDLLTVSAQYQADRVFNHSGTGTVGIYSLSVTHGTVSTAAGNAFGGCISTKGHLFLGGSRVADCVAHSSASFGFGGGGGIYAVDGVTILSSIVTNNTALGTFGSDGGGIESGGKLIIDNSAITNNYAMGGGGVSASGSANNSFSIDSSVISGNVAALDGAGVYVSSFPSTALVSISNSTIANNAQIGSTAFLQGTVGGGISVSNAPIVFQNDTIAFNSSTGGGAGITLNGGGATDFTARFESTIVSNNTTAGVANDLVIVNGTSIGPSANNLVYSSSGALPANFGLPEGTCPLLAPLAGNGGATQTMALHTSSPAIGSGNDSGGFSTDQRGVGFPRSRSGSFGLQFTDIGAYQVQFSDVIFSAGFDGCP